MAQSTSDIKKSQKKRTPRGRPRTGIGQAVLVRLSPLQMARLDDWMAEQEFPPSSRPEAVRRLMERGLAAESAAAAKPRRPAAKPAGGKG
jgi:hypothetical protein